MSGHQWVTRTFGNKATHQICTIHGTDHGLACLQLAADEAGEKTVSAACHNPVAQQAEIQPRDRGRRHPHPGRRPEWSGYCVMAQCSCDCHDNESQDEIEEI